MNKLLSALVALLFTVGVAVLFAVGVARLQDAPVLPTPAWAICGGGEGFAPNPGPTRVGDIWLPTGGILSAMQPTDFVVAWSFGYTGDVPGEQVVPGPINVPPGWNNAVNLNPQKGLPLPDELIYNLSYKFISDPSSEPADWIWQVPTTGDGPGGGYIENVICAIGFHNVSITNPGPIQTFAFGGDWPENQTGQLPAVNNRRQNSLLFMPVWDDDTGWAPIVPTPSGWSEPAPPVNGGFPNYNGNCCALDAFTYPLLAAPSSSPATTITMLDTHYGMPYFDDSGLAIAILLDGR